MYRAIYKMSWFITGWSSVLSRFCNHKHEQKKTVIKQIFKHLEMLLTLSQFILLFIQVMNRKQKERINFLIRLIFRSLLTNQVGGLCGLSLWGYQQTFFKTESGQDLDNHQNRVLWKLLFCWKTKNPSLKTRRNKPMEMDGWLYDSKDKPKLNQT